METNFNFNYTWDGLPIEMKQEFADLNELDLIANQDELYNLWRHARYLRGLE